PLTETPRPPTRPTIPSAPAASPRAPGSPDRPSPLPSRKTLQDGSPATAAPAPLAPAPGRNVISRWEINGLSEPAPKRRWAERLGSVGIAVFAVVACVVAWLVTYLFF